jgi:hypothetical protein
MKVEEFRQLQSILDSIETMVPYTRTGYIKTKLFSDNKMPINKFGLTYEEQDMLMEDSAKAVAKIFSDHIEILKNKEI